MPHPEAGWPVDLQGAGALLVDDEATTPAVSAQNRRVGVRVSLSAEQVDALAEGFQVVANRSFRMPFVPLLTRVIKSPRLRKRVWQCDAWTLRRFPAAAHFATGRVFALKRVP